MNSITEHLNQLGGQFLDFAWPMLWQSSLLIGLVFAGDLLLARGIRASIRHALWLVVLVKLLLPPSLALPTSAAWWLFPAKPVIKSPAPRTYVVTYDAAAPPPAPILRSVPFVPTQPKLDRAGWSLLATGIVSTALLVWLLLRWGQVVRMVRRAGAGEEFFGPLAEVRRLAGLRGPVRVKLVDARTSPAVCGLFRPVILLPRLLAEQLSASQLRAVLLHEAIHLCRLDIWVNCVQGLLQVIYWWHPLVWMANARIRWVREEAVDDAVMVALADHADVYAPTLLEVAKLAFRRPLMSLGLVGIMESRSALRQRIERLVAFRAPRKVGLTCFSLLGILAFSAVALPMGQGPASAAADAPSAPAPAAAASGLPPTVQPAHPPAVLIQAEIYQMPEEAFKNLVSDLHFSPGHADSDGWWSASPERYTRLLSDLKKSGLTAVQRPRIQTFSGGQAQFFVGNDAYGTEIDCLPVVTAGKVNLAVEGKIEDRSAGGGSTNSFKANALLENRAGMVIRFQNDLSNSVVFWNVEILTNPPSGHSQQRLAPTAKPPPAGAMISPVAGVADAVDTQASNAREETVAKMSDIRTLPKNTASIPVPGAYATNGLVWTAPGRQAILSKLDRIRLDRVSFDGLPLSEVLKELCEQCQLRDPERKGINFLINNSPDMWGQPIALPSLKFFTGPAAPNIDPNTGLPVAPAAENAATEQQDIGQYQIRIPSLTNVLLADVLDTIVSVADHPIKYTVRDYAVVFQAKGPESPQLFTRTFKVATNVFLPNLSRLAGLNGPHRTNSITVSAMLRSVFQDAGVDFTNPPGKSVFYNIGMGMVFVKATKEDLDTIEKIIVRLNQPVRPLNALGDQSMDEVPQTVPDRVTARTLIQDGKLFYEMGKFNDAEMKLNQAMQLDPGNATASYYLDLTKQANGSAAKHDGAGSRDFGTSPQNDSAGRQMTNDATLFTMTFRVDPNTFIAALEGVRIESLAALQHDASGLAYITSQTSGVTPSKLAKVYFTTLGVDLENPPGKAVFFNDRLGYLFVKATKGDLDTIERSLQMLFLPEPPQIHVKVRFLEVPKGTLDGFRISLASTLATTNQLPDQITDILSHENVEMVLRDLESRDGMENLGEPEATVSSGRRVQVRAARTIMMVTNVVLHQADHGPSSFAQEYNPFEVGPVLDIVANVLADGYTINLEAMPSLTLEEGFKTIPLTTYNPEDIKYQNYVPELRTRQITAVVNLRDGQTLVLGGLGEIRRPKLPPRFKGKEGFFDEAWSTNVEWKEFLVLITPTIVDAAGNRIHTDDEALLAPNPPPQPK